jgi:hypothetical protein
MYGELCAGARVIDREPRACLSGSGNAVCLACVPCSLESSPSLPRVMTCTCGRERAAVAPLLAEPGWPLHRSSCRCRLWSLWQSNGTSELACEKLPHLFNLGQHSQLCSYGIISRSGWVLLDDTQRPRFDDDPVWPWVVSPPSRPSTGPEVVTVGVNAHTATTSSVLRCDWYLFAHGLEFPKAMADYTAVAGPIAMPPKFALGVFFSRWWPFNDVESRDIISDYQAFSIPLDVMVTDMDW